MQLRWQETTRGSPASDGFRELILPLVQTCGVCRGTQWYNDRAETPKQKMPSSASQVKFWWKVLRPQQPGFQ